MRPMKLSTYGKFKIVHLLNMLVNISRPKLISEFDPVRCADRSAYDITFASFSRHFDVTPTQSCTASLGYRWMCHGANVISYEMKNKYDKTVSMKTHLKCRQVMYQVFISLVVLLFSRRLTGHELTIRVM